jgi:hypothetical protein
MESGEENFYQLSAEQPTKRLTKNNRSTAKVGEYAW